MRNIFIIHGSYGHPEENWFPWLKQELEILGHRVFVPKFPVPKGSTPGGHKLDKWMKEGVIRNKSKHIEIFQSSNDVVPVSEGQRIAINLHAKINILKNAEHFNIATYKRFVKFPLLLEHIKRIL